MMDNISKKLHKAIDDGMKIKTNHTKGKEVGKIPFLDVEIVEGRTSHWECSISKVVMSGFTVCIVIYFMYLIFDIFRIIF